MVSRLYLRFYQLRWLFSRFRVKCFGLTRVFFSQDSLYAEGPAIPTHKQVMHLPCPAPLPHFFLFLSLYLPVTFSLTFSLNSFPFLPSFPSVFLSSYFFSFLSFGRAHFSFLILFLSFPSLVFFLISLLLFSIVFPDFICR